VHIPDDTVLNKLEINCSTPRILSKNLLKRAKLETLSTYLKSKAVPLHAMEALGGEEV
jgi:hypothetical protein